MTRKVKGFTLVELLVVAVVLAIFAAIVVPQFASTTDEAKVSAVKSDLSGLRSAIDLYRQQHGHWPGSVAASGGTCTGGTAGTGAANSMDALKSQLTMYTDATGKACSIKGASYPYGPYIGGNDIPKNALTGVNTVAMIGTGNLNIAGTAAPAATSGWRYDYTIGKIIIDNSDYQNF